VVSIDGKVIPGLYAAGELVGGIFWFNYPGGSGLTNGAVFGRIAGANAGARAASLASPASAVTRRPTEPS
jgi:tricarballylate dehydrogenase